MPPRTTPELAEFQPMVITAALKGAAAVSRTSRQRPPVMVFRAPAAHAPEFAAVGSPGYTDSVGVPVSDQIRSIV